MRARITTGSLRIRTAVGMDFGQVLTTGTLIRRYKRFLADVCLDDGTRITCHCPNTGSMLGCSTPGSRVWLSRADNPRRKYAYTWEMVELPGAGLVGIHTGHPNALVEEAITSGRLPVVAGYARVRREVTLPGGGTRVDLLLEGHPDRPPCYVEVKNVTAAVEGGVALFPDAVSERGRRHLEALQSLLASGSRAMLVFCVQRGDVNEVRPADEIDPRYGRALRAAIAAGVEVHALRAQPTIHAIRLESSVPVVCP